MLNKKLERNATMTKSCDLTHVYSVSEPLGFAVWEPIAVSGVWGPNLFL